MPKRPTRPGAAVRWARERLYQAHSECEYFWIDRGNGRPLPEGGYSVPSIAFAKALRSFERAVRQDERRRK